MEISKRNKKLSRSIPEDVEYDLTEKRRRTDGMSFIYTIMFVVNK